MSQKLYIITTHCLKSIFSQFTLQINSTVIEKNPSIFITFAIRKSFKQSMSKILICIFLGGGTGSLLRYCMQMALHERIVPYAFPWATFTVNILGSFLIGLFYAWSARFNLSTEIRMLLTTGLCGGFTTFSTFSNDGLIMLKQGFYGEFFLYILLSVLLSIMAAFTGGVLGRWTGYTDLFLNNPILPQIRN